MPFWGTKKQKVPIFRAGYYAYAVQTIRLFVVVMFSLVIIRCAYWNFASMSCGSPWLGRISTHLFFLSSSIINVPSWGRGIQLQCIICILRTFLAGTVSQLNSELLQGHDLQDYHWALWWNASWMRTPHIILASTDYDHNTDIYSVWHNGNAMKYWKSLLPQRNRFLVQVHHYRTIVRLSFSFLIWWLTKFMHFMHSKVLTSKRAKP